MMNRLSSEQCANCCDKCGHIRPGACSSLIAVCYVCLRMLCSMHHFTRLRTKYKNFVPKICWSSSFIFKSTFCFFCCCCLETSHSTSVRSLIWISLSISPKVMLGNIMLGKCIPFSTNFTLWLRYLNNQNK